MTRSAFLRFAAGTVAALALGGGAGQAAAGAMKAMQRRAIPASGELLPVIGLGTYQGFDAAPGSEEYGRLPAVLRTLFAAGGAVVDSSPMYGLAEAVTGELIAANGNRRKAFVATKVWTRGQNEGVRQMEQSLRLLRAEPLDLMQVHNLVDWRTQLATLRDWKAAGRIRYLGVTHYHAGAYPELAAVMRAERLDFLQINYSLDEREAERLILPLAAERGMAVLINRPFGGGGLLRRLRERPLPVWAGEIEAASWAQLLLKFVLSQPAVTCAIPGTGRPEHMADNAGAGRGRIPDAAFWRHHPELFDL
ncbi:aldo/keto reductase [Dechloromonas sp. A34]|uniref:aldo/keto reductase n=1 Tax=Dechloromonas sp. A34 TaxID=447588 RepID=UPI00224968F3|nr:aldo/keto reductase [Dechloromonas sp. A34]